VSIPIEDGAFVVLVGPSGCGKSTLCGCSPARKHHLDAIVATRVVITSAQRAATSPWCSRINALYPHMTVADNSGFFAQAARGGTPMRSKGRQARREILGAEPLLDRYPRPIVGRPSASASRWARAIVRDPQVFLFDEPFRPRRQAARGDAHRNQGLHSG